MKEMDVWSRLTAWNPTAWNPRCARNNLWNLATLGLESTNLYSQQLGVNMELDW